MNPRSRRARRAIEVYPHPATVALFRLGRTLKYKDKPGRDLEQLRVGAARLLGLLEGLASADPPLLVDGSTATGRRAGGRAGRGDGEPQERAAGRRGPGRRRGVRLRRPVRDPQARADHDIRRFRDRLHRHPDAAGGPDADAAGSRTPRSHDPVAPPSASTPSCSPSCAGGATSSSQLVTSLLDDAGINYLSVTGRAKSVASFATKAARTVDGRPRLTDPLREITDQIGLRVITYVHSDVDGRRRPARPTSRRPSTTATWARRRRARAVSATPAGTCSSAWTRPASQPAYELLRGRSAQVQIRTVLQHAWAEFEHDIRYKGTIPDEHVPDLDRRFTLAAGLLELADREFSTIRDRLRHEMTGARRRGRRRRPADQPRELAAFLAGQLRRRRLVAHRPLRVDLRAAARAGHHVPGRARRPSALGGRGALSASGWTTATRRAPCGGSTTPAVGVRRRVRRAARQRRPGACPAGETGEDASR